MNNNQKGFTLIEMLVVVAIVGLLSSVVVVGVGGAREKARDAKRIADIRQIQTYLEANYANGAYPASLPANVTPPIAGEAYSYCQSGESYTAGADLENGGNKPLGAAASSTCTLAPLINCADPDKYCVTP